MTQERKAWIGRTLACEGTVERVTRRMTGQ
jgi:hypothetical protein